jgi:integrase
MGKGDKTAARKPYFGLPRWTPHDLRRTAATKLSELGCSDEIIDAILNHAKHGVIGIYNRNKYDKEKQEWLVNLSDKLLKLITT